MKHPLDRSHSLGPGPEAAERHMQNIRAAEQPNYAAMTEQLWADAWGPPHPDDRGPITYLLDIAHN